MSATALYIRGSELISADTRERIKQAAALEERIACSETESDETVALGTARMLRVGNALAAFALASAVLAMISLSRPVALLAVTLGLFAIYAKADAQQAGRA